MAKKFKFICKGCSAIHYLTMEKAGKRMRCPHCQFLMKITAEVSQPQSEKHSGEGEENEPKKVTITIIKTVTPSSKELPEAAANDMAPMTSKKKEYGKGKLGESVTTIKMPKQKQQHETKSLLIQRRGKHRETKNEDAVNDDSPPTARGKRSEIMTTMQVSKQKRRRNKTKSLPIQKRCTSETNSLPISGTPKPASRENQAEQLIPALSTKKRNRQQIVATGHQTRSLTPQMPSKQPASKEDQAKQPMPVLSTKKRNRQQIMTTIEMPKQKRQQHETRALPIQKRRARETNVLPVQRRPDVQVVRRAGDESIPTSRPLPARKPVVEKIVDPALAARVPKYDPDRTPLYSRNKWYWWQLAIKWSAVVSVAFLLIVVVGIYRRQAGKPVEQLFQEYVDKDSPRFILWINHPLIRRKIQEENLPFLLESSKEQALRTRIMVAECLEILGTSKGFDILATYLKSDASSRVRQAAAQALGTIREKRCVDLLIKCLSTEINQDVLGSIARSLRYMTGETGKSFNADYWKHWWRESREEFYFQRR